MPNEKRLDALIAEAVGTFALVFAATGSIMVNDLSGGVVTHVGIAAAPGLVVAAMIYAVGDISAAHFNPAVTIGFWSVGRLPARLVAPYLLSQITGALLASLALWLLLPADRGSMGAHVPALPAAASVVMEIILTFLLTFVILGVSGYLNAAPAAAAVNRQPSSGLAVGAVVALAIWFAGPTSGASMNPARSLAPALFAGDPLRHLWIYVVGPVTGALLAGAVGRLLRAASRPRP